MGNSFSYFGLMQGELSTSPQPGFLMRSQGLWVLWATRPLSSSNLWSATGFELESNGVDPAEPHRSKVDLGITVIIFLQANHFTDQRLGDEYQLTLPFDFAVAAHAAQCEITGIDWILQPGWIGPWRDSVNRGRHRLAQGFVWALMVKLLTEFIEAPLLSIQRSRRRLGGFRLKGLMHAFMAAVLLRFTRHDPHRRDT